jgi:hypothetical protein
MKINIHILGARILSTTWVLKENIIQKLMVFERRVLRKIFGPTKELNGLWRIKTNEEMDGLIQRKNIIGFIKSQRLKWLGHVERMPKEREVTRIYKYCISHLPLDQ